MSDRLTVWIGGTPSGQGRVECSCTYEGRCDKHAAMMRVLADLYWGDWKVTGDRVERYIRFCDGYGEIGFCPDWSGIRDSSPYAIEKMHEEATR